MGRWLLIFATATLVLLAGWLFYQQAWISSRAGVATPLYSSERYDPYGSAALYRLLERRSNPVSRLLRPTVSREMTGVLIQVISNDEDFLPDIDQKKEKDSDADGDDEHDDAGDEPVAQSPPVAQTQPAQPAEDAAQTQPSESSSHGWDATLQTSDELLAWVSQGNTLIQLSRKRTREMNKAGIPWGPSDAPQPDMSIENLQRQGTVPDELPLAHQASWTDNAKALYPLAGRGPWLRSPMAFGLEGRLNWQPLAMLNGQVVAGQMSYGKGRIVVIGAPTPALNHTLGHEENLSLMLHLVGQQPVIFDEWIHQLGQAGTMMSLIRHFGLLPLLLQLVLLVLVYHWSTQNRRAAMPPATERPRSSVEQIHTLGHLYQQSMNDSVAAMRVAREVRRRVALGLSCPVTQIERRIKLVDPALADQAQQLLEKSQSLTGRWPGACQHCGYDLTNVQGAPCPGCGQLGSKPNSHAHVAAEASEKMGSSGSSGSSRVHAELAHLLSLSHDFATGNKP